MSFPAITHPEQDNDKLKEKGVSIVAFLDTVRPRKDKTFTVRLRIIYNRFPKYYTTKINISTKEWLKLVESKRLGEDLKEKRTIIYKLIRKAYTIIYELPVFTFESFDKKFLRKTGDATNIYFAFDEYIKECKSEDRLGTASSYEYARNAIKEFSRKEKLKYEVITPKFLKDFEKWWERQDKSLTSVGIYLRCVRHLYNRAIKAGDVGIENYPFGNQKDGKYAIPQPQNLKLALPLSDIKKIFEYKPKENSPEHFHRDMWIFSYLCNGINVKDLCLLKYKDITREQIQFRRAKTINTNKSAKPIDAIITEEVKQIVSIWGTKPADPNKYVFPFLENGLTAIQIQGKVKQATKQINKYIKRVAKNIGIDANISTYTARHSFATVLKRSGAPVSFISESLGHTDIKTTQSYLASFENDAKREMTKKLTDWD
ncbi:MAG: site-specific integrase [Bacteroidales bacterium]|nr:site-specific integrase [Bacteroidales bacterium]